MKKTVLIYGLLLAVLLVVLKTLEYRWLIKDISWQLYVAAVALMFLGLGVWLARMWFKPHVAEDNAGPNTQAIKALGLSAREVQVLQKLATGASNQVIADELFVSVNTIKTHLKNAFIKLEVSNRVQAINKLKDLKIIYSDKNHPFG